jgi:hypothetical protein
VKCHATQHMPTVTHASRVIAIGSAVGPTGTVQLIGPACRSMPTVQTWISHATGRPASGARKSPANLRGWCVRLPPERGTDSARVLVDTWIVS